MDPDPSQTSGSVTLIKLLTVHPSYFINQKVYTVCPSSLDPFLIVSYNIKGSRLLGYTVIGVINKRKYCIISCYASMRRLYRPSDHLSDRFSFSTFDSRFLAGDKETSIKHLWTVFWEDFHLVFAQVAQLLCYIFPYTFLRTYTIFVFTF